MDGFESFDFRIRSLPVQQLHYSTDATVTTMSTIYARRQQLSTFISSLMHTITDHGAEHAVILRKVIQTSLCRFGNWKVGLGVGHES
jgi:hypothetical protein